MSTAAPSDGYGRCGWTQYRLLHNADPTYILFRARRTFCTRIEQKQPYQLYFRDRRIRRLADGISRNWVSARSVVC
jgi:hypothetical protein